jgi:glycerophosphoryl diester phosphodiesterase
MKPFALLALALGLFSGPVPAFDLQGHRGARGLAPENTLAAFDLARSLGVTTLELDIALTKDDIVVISHDPALNPDITRDAGGRWLDATGPAIRSLTLAELQRYDVGRLKPNTRYAGTYPQQQPRDGERIPTLAALFDRIAAAGDTALRFNIETKLKPREPQGRSRGAGGSAPVRALPSEPLAPDASTLVRALLDVVRAYRLEPRVTVQSFDWSTLRETQRLAPAIPTSCLTVRQQWLDNLHDGRWTAGLRLADHGGSVPRLVKAAGCAQWSPYFGELDAASLAEARSLGLKVIPWTVNRPEDIERMLALPLDGIITDHPDRVREAMKARGMTLPSPP